MKTLIAVVALLAAAPAVAAESSCSTSVYFDTGRAAIAEKYKAALDVVAGCIKGDEFVVHVDAVGSADARPVKGGNEALAQLRADMVKAYLVARFVDDRLIQTSSTGDSKPACSERTPECFAKNRRVDVSVVRNQHVYAVVIPVVVEKKVEHIVYRDVPAPVKPETWEIMVFAEFGAHKDTNGYPSKLETQKDLHGSFNNWGVWLAGTEFHYLPAHVGLRTQAGNTGIGAIFQVFPVQGRLNWYVGAGAAYTQYPFYRPSVPEVQRYWDVQVQTGIEYAFTTHIVGLLDVRTSIPLPWTNTDPLSGKNVRDALSQTAVLGGLGYRF